MKGCEFAKAFSASIEWLNGSVVLILDSVYMLDYVHHFLE